MKKIIIDVETNGTRPDYHELTEISILDCETLNQITWEVKIRFPQRCSKEALMITNKTPEELMSRGRYIETILDEVDEFIKSISEDPDDIVALAHNASFDRNFMETKWKQHNRIFPVNYWLDTLQMSRRFTKTILGIQKTSHALGNMMKHAGLSELPGAHASTVDCQNLFRLYTYMKQRGLQDSEFIKLSPSLMQNLTKTSTKKPVAKKQKTDLSEITNVISSLENDGTNVVIGAADYEDDEDKDEYSAD